MRTSLLLCTALTLLTGACVRPGQNQYTGAESGVSRSIILATVMQVRTVPIKNKDTGVGLLGGAVAGGAAGSTTNNGWATAGAALVGAVAGSLLEQNVSERQGLEYIIRTDEGDVKSIVQEQQEGDVTFKKGDRVMLQACDAGDNYKRCKAGGDYQRLLPTDIPAPAKTAAAKKKHHRHVDADVEIEAPADSGL